MARQLHVRSVTKGNLTSLEGEPRSIAAAVLRYLSRNRDARDTVDGILNWWIAAEGAAWPSQEVGRVLEVLVARGVLSARGETAERRVYGLNPDCDVRRFLAEIESGQ